MQLLNQSSKNKRTKIISSVLSIATVFAAGCLIFLGS